MDDIADRIPQKENVKYGNVHPPKFEQSKIIVFQKLILQGHFQKKRSQNTSPYQKQQY